MRRVTRSAGTARASSASRLGRREQRSAALGSSERGSMSRYMLGAPYDSRCGPRSSSAASECSQLAVEVQQFATGVPEEQPTRHAVVEGAQVEEQHESGSADEPAVPPETGWPCKGRGKHSSPASHAATRNTVSPARKADVRDHRTPPRTPGRPGSTRPAARAGFTRTKAFGTWSRRTKSTCATNVSRARSWRVPGRVEDLLEVDRGLERRASSARSG